MVEQIKYINLSKIDKSINVAKIENGSNTNVTKGINTKFAIIINGFML